MNDEEQLFVKNINKGIEYVQKNVAGLTLIATAAITVGSVLLKYIYYLIELGYTKYFHLSSSLIDIADDNILYSIVANGVISLFYALICFLPYWIYKSKTKTWKKVLYVVFITLIPFFLLLASFVELAVQGVLYDSLQYIIAMIVGIILGLMLFSPGYLLIIDEKTNSKKAMQNKEEIIKKTLFEKLKRIVIEFLLLVIIESVIIYGFGYYKAYSQNEFKIIKTSDGEFYTVLYETNESYIISNCEITEKKIHIVNSVQKEISKENVEYDVRQLIQVLE